MFRCLSFLRVLQVEGITLAILEKALVEARKGRSAILGRTSS